MKTTEPRAGIPRPSLAAFWNRVDPDSAARDVAAEARDASTTLIVPGLWNSGPDHWQSRWCELDPPCRRVELGGWDAPDRDLWISRLDCAIMCERGRMTLSRTASAASRSPGGRRRRRPIGSAKWQARCSRRRPMSIPSTRNRSSAASRRRRARREPATSSISPAPRDTHVAPVAKRSTQGIDA